MPKKFNTQIGPRDIEILTAIDRTALTASQLRNLSDHFGMPFRDENNLRRRLRRLAKSGLIRSWPYALVSDGRSPSYFRLTRDGFRLLYGNDAPLPSRRQFEEISHGHHHHTYSLAELIVRLVCCGGVQGIQLRHFARENSLKLQSGGFSLFPDCAFQLLTKDGRTFNFVVELDNGTERVRSRQDVESIERKLRGYDLHQSQYDAHHPQRYFVLIVTTRSENRLNNMLDLAAMVMRNPQRTVFLGCTLEQVINNDPFMTPVFVDHRQLRRTLIPTPSITESTEGTSKSSIRSRQQKSIAEAAGI